MGINENSHILHLVDFGSAEFFKIQKTNAHIEY